MAYHSLSNDTGQTPERRSEEAQEIVKMLFGELGEGLDMMADKERAFVTEIEGAHFCSPKQLFWLRDLKEKYL